MVILLLWLMLFKSYSCENIQKYFEEINEHTKIFNSIAADIAWQISLEPDKDGLLEKSAKFQQKKISWQHSTCRTLTAMHDHLILNSTQERMAYLLCRGPKYYYKEARQMSNVYEELQSIYSNNEVCFTDSERTTNLTEIETAILNYITTVAKHLNFEHSDKNPVEIAAKMALNENKNGFLCLKGEEDFEKIMRFSKKPKVLEWVWLVWRENIKKMRKLYRRLVDLENKAARRNGYRDLGDSWRDEIEVPNLRAICHQLYQSIKPLYALLHGVVRFYLRKEYGVAVDEKGPIPAHLLGNLWSQNWEPVADLILPKVINLDERIQNRGWKVGDMIKRAEDFYISLGLPPMTDKFWRQSVFTRKNHELARCHGAAADMFQDDDFRLLYCAGVTFEDLYVIHHEIGHIQYYMAYEKQAALFRQANTVLHESIGDTIMYGVMTPQHLHRLRFINDSELFIPINNIKKNKKILRHINRNSEKLSTISTNKSEEFESHEESNNYHNFKINIYDNHFKFMDNTNETNNKFKYNSKNIDGIESKNNNGHDEFRSINNDSKDYRASTTNINNYEAFNKDSDNYVKLQADNRKLVKDQEDTVDFITIDDVLMLKQALNKIPQIPFALLMDEYRWKYFEGSLDKDLLNQEFWDFARDLQGITPPNYRDEGYFDIGAKFHLPDNTPYIRYFLSSFLQHQLFEVLCKAAVFGHRNTKEPIPYTISLNRCDIYGSKAAGKILKDIMSRGTSQHWQQILQETIGKSEFSAASLKRYYRPLYKLLKRLVEKYDIPIGW